MAPEVALRKPYNEKVDVYSFGIMVWQMATDKVPFKGYNRDQFIKEVVVGKLRPKLDSSWPVGFSNLLNACWHNDPNARPSFTEVVMDLNSLIGDTGVKKRGKVIRPTADVSKGDRASSSTWF
jgi:serine/threonine protein kinase